LQCWNVLMFQFNVVNFDLIMLQCLNVVMLRRNFSPHGVLPSESDVRTLTVLNIKIQCLAPTCLPTCATKTADAGAEAELKPRRFRAAAHHLRRPSPMPPPPTRRPLFLAPDASPAPRPNLPWPPPGPCRSASPCRWPSPSCSRSPSSPTSSGPPPPPPPLAASPPSHPPPERYPRRAARIALTA